jgi:hypothetical protein
MLLGVILGLAGVDLVFDFGDDMTDDDVFDGL